jgi:hypothetical protein
MPDSITMSSKNMIAMKDRDRTGELEQARRPKQKGSGGARIEVVRQQKLPTTKKAMPEGIASPQGLLLLDGHQNGQGEADCQRRRDIIGVVQNAYYEPAMRAAYCAALSRSILLASSVEIGSAGMAFCARSHRQVRYLLFAACSSRCL